MKNFTVRLKWAKLATEDDLTDFGQKTYFDEKLAIINRKVNSSQVKHVEKKLKDYMTSYTKLINDLTREVKLISKKD